MSSDPYEQHMCDWLRGVQVDTRARREQQNADSLISKLVWRGYTVRCDKTHPCLIVTLEPGREIAITLSNAREMNPDVLVQWVERVCRRDAAVSIVERGQ